MKKIIIVEDDVSILEMMTLMMEIAGHSVKGYSDGAGMMANEYALPDLFIIDKQLPGIDGLDICRHLKSQASTKEIPVMMVSAKPGIVELAREAMADDALEKPFAMKKFTDMVAQLLGSK